jgi:muramidase (phage lysozyme)
MTFTDKLTLSAFIIKRSYAGYSPIATGANLVSSNDVVPKAIPVAVAKSAPNSEILGPAVSLLDSPDPSTKPRPVLSKAKPRTTTSSLSPYQPILDVIRKGESNTAGYDALVGSNKPFGLTGKTLQQVLDIQKERLKTYGGTAAGGYQILNKNLMGLAAQHKHDLNKTTFDQKTQDTYGRSLMDRRGFKDFLAGKINPDQMRINLAKEWAALPAKGERSYYHGTGNNAARVPSKEINDAIAKSLELYRKSTAPAFFNQVGELP